MSNIQLKHCANERLPIYLNRVIVKTEPMEVKTSEPSPTILEDKTEPIASVIKTEHIELSDNEDDDKRSDNESNSSLVKHYSKLDAESVKKSILSDTNSISINAGGTDSKYCHVCDIKFTYLDTFIAHKRGYCKGLRNDLDAATATTNATTAVIATAIKTARSSPNQASVVT